LPSTRYLCAPVQIAGLYPVFASVILHVFNRYAAAGRHKQSKRRALDHRSRGEGQMYACVSCAQTRTVSPILKSSFSARTVEGPKPELTEGRRTHLRAGSDTTSIHRRQGEASPKGP
jgi:hypothetical protein